MVEMPVRASASCQSDLAVLVAIGGELARGEAGDEGRLGEGGGGGAEHAGELERAGRLPARLAVGGVERVELAVLGEHPDIVVADGRRLRAAGRPGLTIQTWLPVAASSAATSPAPLVDVEPAIVVADAAAVERLALAVLAADLMLPDWAPVSAAKARTRAMVSIV